MSKKTSKNTFIIDCPQCKARVVAPEEGTATRVYKDEDGYPSGEKLLIGNCPKCGEFLAGISMQTGFKDIDDFIDRWSDVVQRVYPKPPKTFLSNRIPRAALESLSEADRSLQANANIAACAMLGRALEAVCRDHLDAEPSALSAATKTPPKRRVMLAEGIKMLRDKEIIDDRLYEWSQQLHAFRNLAAHPDEENSISRQDAEDLQSFVYAIFDYVYDLTDKYKEFKERLSKKT